MECMRVAFTFKHYPPTTSVGRKLAQYISQSEIGSALVRPIVTFSIFILQNKGKKLVSLKEEEVKVNAVP